MQVTNISELISKPYFKKDIETLIKMTIKFQNQVVMLSNTTP